MIVVSNELLLHEAQSFITKCYQETGNEFQLKNRLNEIKKEISEKGTYSHTFEELQYGARVAWRNSNKCIGRFFWDKLHVIDARASNSDEQVYDDLLHHISYATNDGKIKPTITIFKPYHGEQNQVKIYNQQLIRYAGYETENGIIGDSLSVPFTNFCKELGWSSEQTNFDILPLVFSVDGKKPSFFEIPSHLIKEVQITHPTLSFESLNLKWYGVPIISDMRLEIGGINYTAAPFNGWYMGTEIGARNLADEYRYNMLPKVAEILECDSNSNSTLWKDRALLELNVAVLHSFKEAGVSIVDHHTAAKQFQEFEAKEHKQARDVTGRWSWLIPPMSASTTHVFHKSYHDTVKTPNFFICNASLD